MKMATIREIAELANVSIGTVSFVLNGKGTEMRISETTQLRVLEAAKELGYQPSLSARRLQSNEKAIPVIAILWTLDTRTSLISRFLQGIQKKSLYNDGTFELVIQPYENDKLDEVGSLMSGMHFNGAIVANASKKDLQYLEGAELKVPIVLYQRMSEKYSAVFVDSKKTGGDVAEAFIAGGHRNIGLVIPQISSQAVELRELGFKEKIEAHNLQLKNENIRYGEFSEEGGYNVTKKLIEENEILPTAIFYLSDHMALGALTAFYEAGIKVPEELEIIGHDNEEFTRFTMPPLSTIHLPVEEMAEACVRQLLGIIKHEVNASDSILFESNLIERKSMKGK